MGPKEKALARDAYVARLVGQLDKQGDRTNLLNRIGQSPAARKEMEAVLGKADADALTARLRVESVMDRMRGALGNSTTARQLVEAGLAGGAGGIILTGGDILQGGGYGAVLAMAMRKSAGAVGVRIDHNVSRRVAEMLASSDGAVVERGIEMVQRNPTLRRVLEGTDNFLAKTAGTQTPPE